MTLELCNEAMKMVTEVMVFDAISLSLVLLKTKNRLKSYELLDQDIGFIRVSKGVTNHKDKSWKDYTSNEFISPGTLQTDEPKKYSVISMNEESVD